MPGPQNISLSIGIVCYNSTHDELHTLVSSLIPAIKTLQDSFQLCAVKIFIVDNSETADWDLTLLDRYSANLGALHAEIQLLRGHGNIGFGRGHNLVINELKSTYHLILNPDVTLDQMCLLEGIKFLDQNPNTAVASPYATGIDGRKQHLCKTYPALFTFLVRGFVPAQLQQLFGKRLARFEMHHLSETESSHGIPIASGCFMLCRTGYLQKVHGFDENYFLYFEDFDISLRIGKIGDIVYLPAMKIWHAGGHASRKGRKHLAMFARSAIYFFHTHGWRLFRQD